MDQTRDLCGGVFVYLAPECNSLYVSMHHAPMKHTLSSPQVVHSMREQAPDSKRTAVQRREAHVRDVQQAEGPQAKHHYHPVPQQHVRLFNVRSWSHFPKFYVLLTLHETPVRAMLALTTIPALPTMHATLARYNLAGLVAEREAAGQRILLRDKNDKLVILCNDGNYYWFVAVVQ